MCSFQLLLSVDPSLGRVDYSLLSDQTLMEMLIEGFDDGTKKNYKDKNGMYLNMCKCSSIKCDADERVTEIRINSGSTSGSLELCYVPPNVKELRISSWSSSKLTGSVNLACLPNGMKCLSLYKNQLTGEIDLTRLPHKMEYLYLNNNRLTGEIDFTQLPERMHSINLSYNQLSGSLVIKKIPETMSLIDVQVNHFNAIAVTDTETQAIVQLRKSGVTSVVDESGKSVKMRHFLR